MLLTSFSPSRLKKTGFWYNKDMRALILHGTAATSKSNWFSWLGEELKKIGWEVWVPDLPNAARPNIQRYNKFILKNKDFVFDEDTILVGHSSGSVAILGLLQALPDGTKVNSCFLVGVFKDDLGWDSLKELFLEPIDYEKVKNRAEKFILIHSDNDPHCPLEGAEYVNGKLSGELIIRPGQGHFNTEHSSGYSKFPFLLELIIGRVE